MANLSGRFVLSHDACKALGVMLRSHWRYKKTLLLGIAIFWDLTWVRG